MLSSSTLGIYAGNGTAAYTGDGGKAINASLDLPGAVAVDHAGNLFIADAGNYAVRKVAVSNGIITTVAGNGNQNYFGDGGPATSASFNYVFGIAVNSAGTTVTVTDANNSDYGVVRQFAVGGKIGTVAGGAGNGYCGDSGPATSACLTNPYSLAVTSSGIVYVADTGNDRIRQFQVGGTINLLAGNGTPTCLRLSPASRRLAWCSTTPLPLWKIRQATSSSRISQTTCCASGFTPRTW